MTWRDDPAPGHVYIFVELCPLDHTPGDCDCVLFVKVGESNDPEDRVRGLQTGNGRRIVIDQIVECYSKAEAQEIERYAQKILEAAGWQASADNEWFGCPVAVAMAAVDEAMAAVGGGWWARRVALPLRARVRAVVASLWGRVRWGLRLVERGFAVAGVVGVGWLLFPILT